MYGGYEGGWVPSTYLTKEIPLDIYESKAGRPYMDIGNWAKEKWAEEAERDEQLENIYMSAKMMKYHPLMTKELRKTYSLLAAAAMKAMSPEYKYLVKKRFNEQTQQ